MLGCSWPGPSGTPIRVRPVRRGPSLAVLIAVIIGLAIVQARAEPQTRFYNSQGRSVGTATPYGNGSVRYYDARGKSLGTSTTTGSTTRFYDSGGRPTGSATSPGPLAFPRR